VKKMVIFDQASCDDGLVKEPLHMVDEHIDMMKNLKTFIQTVL
jgi:hypothetical protein